MSKIFSTDIEMSGNDITGAGDVGATSISEGGTLLSNKYAPIAHNQAWSTIKSTPTTISGYGITDYNTLGDARWVQKSGDTMTGTLVLPAATTLISSLRFAPGTAPTSPIDGDMWGAGTSLYYHTGTTTRQIVSTSTYSTITQAEAEAGTATSIRWITAQRMRQGVVAYAAPISHTHVAANVTDFDTAVDARISAGAYLPLAGGTMTGDITGSNTKFRARNIANTLFTDFTQNGVVSLADGATQQAELNFFADGTGTKTWGHLIVNGTANMTWENNDTLLNKDLRLSSGVYMVNSTDSCSIGFSTVASPGQPALEIYNTHGAVRIGQASATYAYYETDATKNYFDKALEVYSNVAINAASVTITPAVNMTTTNLYAYKACDKTLIIGGQITKSSNFAAGDTLFTLASGGWPPFTTYAAVATSATAVVTLTISTAGVVTLSTIHHGTVGASMTLSFQTIRG